MNKNLHFKIFSVILLLVSSLSFASANALLDLQTKEVTMNIKNQSIKNVLKEIQKQTNLNFVYDETALSSYSPKTMNVKNVTVESVLKELLSNTDLTFNISNNVIRIVKKTTANTIQTGQKNTLIINGKVIGKDDRKPIVGATVLILGTTTGAITDDAGIFEIKAKPGDEMEVSFTGMIAIKKTLTISESNLTIEMKSDAMAVDDVVVTGIFTRSKELATGSSVTITGKELKMIGNQNILQSLKTLDPSFKILENNVTGSDPNSLPDIELRGPNGIPDLDATYKGNPNQPLFILDGFEVSLQRVIDLDPNRVESISILKDASAAALYGSRSANGVIVIESKAPEVGELRLSYNGDFALVMPDLTDYDVLNAREALELQYDADHFIGNSMTSNLQLKEYYNRIKKNVMEGVDTYWLSKPLRTAFEHRHNFNLTGGDKVIRYGINLSARMTPGAMKVSGRDNIQGGVFLQYRKGGLIFKNDLQITYNKAEDSPYGEFNKYVALNPYVRPFGDNGRPNKLFDNSFPDFLQGSQYNNNPLYDASLSIVDEEQYTNITNNFSLEWKIIESLTVMGRFSLTKQMDETDSFFPASHTMFATLGDPITSPEEYMRRGNASFGTGNSFSMSGDINIRYGQAFGKHNIYAVVGANVMQSKSDNSSVRVEGFPNDEMNSIGFAKQYYKDSRPVSSYGIMRLAGILATFNYSFDRKYLFDFSLKIDGSSNFGVNNRYAPVWSLGVGWNMHKEKWLSETPVSTMKIRGSYGVTASQNFSPFQANTMYSYNTSRHYGGLIPANIKAIGNSDLKWQTTNILNIGYELGFVNNRFMLNIDYYQRKTDNLLADITIAPSTGFSSFKQNVGQTQNTGVDVTIKAMAISKPQEQIYWSINASLAHNNNKITKISNFMKKRNDDAIKSAQEKGQTTPILLYEEGRSLSDIYVVPSLGIDPATGNELFLGKDGTQTFTWNAFDQVAMGNSRPTIEGILGTSFTYKNLSVSVNFRYKMGGQIYNRTLVERVENADLYGNVDRRIYDSRWRKAGDISLYKSIFDKTATKVTSRFLQDENVLSCESVSVGYDIKSERFLSAIKLERLRINAYMNDILRISSVRQERGINYPFANRIAFSISATF